MHYLIRCTLFFLFCCYSHRTTAQQRGMKPISTKPGTTYDKVAMVIGNWKYPDNPLTNPENDAQDMAALFRNLGFEVIYHENLSKVAMEQAHSAFIEKLQGARVGVFYFAGHGFESKNTNTHYLNSVEMRQYHTINQCIDYSLSLATLLADMKESNPGGINLLFIDACRTYKDRSWNRDGPYKGSKVDAPRGTLVFFAASPGQAADENPGKRNGLFTQELLKQLNQPNLEIFDLFRSTANEVYTKNNDQEPYWSGNLYEKFYFSKQNLPETPYEHYKKQADECFAKKDYACAEVLYTAALVIIPNDSYCKKQLSEAMKELAITIKQNIITSSNDIYRDSYTLNLDSQGLIKKAVKDTIASRGSKSTELYEDSYYEKNNKLMSEKFGPDFEKSEGKYCNSFKAYRVKKAESILFQFSLKSGENLKILGVPSFRSTESLPINGMVWAGPQSTIITANKAEILIRAQYPMTLLGQPSNFTLVYQIKACVIDNNNECTNYKINHNACFYYEVK